MGETVAVVVYCPRCDFFLKIPLPRNAIGTHGCAQCGGQMEVYVGRRGHDHEHVRDAECSLLRHARWHRALDNPDQEPPGPIRDHILQVRAKTLSEFAQWVATSRAYNGAPDPGQALYNEGLNGVLPAWAEEFSALTHAATKPIDRESILAETLRLHDQQHGERHCDRKYVQVCPAFQSLILTAGRRLHEADRIPAKRDAEAVRTAFESFLAHCDRDPDGPMQKEWAAKMVRLALYNALGPEADRIATEEKT